MMWSGLNVCIFFDGVETWANFLPLPGSGFSPDGAVAEDKGLGVSAMDVGEEGAQRGLLRRRAGVFVDFRAVEHSEASDVGYMDGVGVVAFHAVGGLVLGLEADDFSGGLDDVVVARVAPPDSLPAGAERIDGGGGEGGRAVDEDVFDLSLVHDVVTLGWKGQGRDGPPLAVVTWLLRRLHRPRRWSWLRRRRRSP